MPTSDKTGADVHSGPSGLRCLWTPPSGVDAELLSAGVQWDAVRAPARLGEPVLALLGEACGAVIRDPYEGRLVWLVRVGAADAWTFPEIAYVQILGAASWLVVPPGGRMASAGPHWVRPVGEGCRLTEAEPLRAALTMVVADALGPRGVVLR